MRLGLILNSQFLPEQNPVSCGEELLAQVRACRDAGFDAVYVVQHFLSQPFQALQLWPLLGRIAAEAGQMRVGSSIFLLTLLNPVYAAEHAATLDVLTGGRFIFGVGLGFRDEEFEAFGVEPRTRAARFNESMDLVLRLLRGEKVTHHGRFFKLTDAEVLPRPVQQPHPPVWMAASADPGVKRAARHGLPWLINPHATVATVGRQLGLYRAELARHGQPVPADVPIFREMAIAATHAQAVRMSRPFLEGKYAAYTEWGLDKPMGQDESLTGSFAELARDRFVIGTPPQCLEEVMAYGDRLGATHVLARVQWPGMSHGDAMRQIELLGEHVLPALARTPDPAPKQAD
jgi:alkanesulfonate monooxygenase SsuD/methylene tetrahydromethanopterin reductase-like flavin-dependent oxidoreductase (luciferase family)